MLLDITSDYSTPTTLISNLASPYELIKSNNELIFNEQFSDVDGKISKTQISTTLSSNDRFLNNENIKISLNNNILSVHSDHSNIDYIIYNILGKTILKGKLNNGLNEINVKQLNVGKYFVKLNNNFKYTFLKSSNH